MIIVVMGVCSCGKTTVAKLLASKLGVGFYDGDDFHPGSNVEKMRSGAALNDGDRFGWLKQLAGQCRQWEQAGGAVLACSALKESYRRILRQSGCEMRFVYLKGSRQQIIERMRQRKGHFMPVNLVDSQFADLQEPADAIVADISNSAEEIAEKVLRTIGQEGG
ncbi:MAG: gluconokinase, partial [Deltaproteobacteria bacterium]|nr:gluconokinase [Deltaproteobacteria bacterium]